MANYQSYYSTGTISPEKKKEEPKKTNPLEMETEFRAHSVFYRIAKKGGRADFNFLTYAQRHGYSPADWQTYLRHTPGNEFAYYFVSKHGEVLYFLKGFPFCCGATQMWGVSPRPTKVENHKALLDDFRCFCRHADPMAVGGGTMLIMTDPVEVDMGDRDASYNGHMTKIWSGQKDCHMTDPVYNWNSTNYVSTLVVTRQIYLNWDGKDLPK